MARPGVAVADIARAVRQASARLGLNGLGFGRLGHGIGLTATEPPSVVEHDPTILEANMVITIEPAAVEDDGLYCDEQIIVVGAEPEILSVYPSVLGARSDAQGLTAPRRRTRPAFQPRGRSSSLAAVPPMIALIWPFERNAGAYFSM